MFGKKGLLVGLCLLVAAALVTPCFAGITVYKEGDKYFKVGGRIQVQYEYEDPDDGESTDDLRLRRFRPYIEGSVHKDWKGKFQIDYAPSDDDDEISVKDAYMQYKGFKAAKITLGNKKFPFSLEELTSSKRQQLVERTLVGSGSFGTPGRQLGLYADGFVAEKTFAWSLGVAMASLEGDDLTEIDFDSLLEGESNTEGWMYGGRLEYHPFGYLKKGQGDFKRETKLALGVAAFGYSDDGDEELAATLIDDVYAVQADVAFRGAGFSADAQVNYITGELNDDSTTGLFEDGDTDLVIYALEGGYMVIPSKLEIVAGYEALDADSYDEVWTRFSLGANYFFQKHDIKLQATYRMSSDIEGVDGDDSDQVFIQAQYVF